MYFIAEEMKKINGFFLCLFLGVLSYSSENKVEVKFSMSKQMFDLL